MNDTIENIALENPAGVRGHAMTCYPSGAEFWPLDPRPIDIHIIDIAHHLAMQCRFNGAIKRFYSVAEHAVIGSDLMYNKARDQGHSHNEAMRLCFEFLNHDDGEAYTGDLIRPIKNGSKCGEHFKTVEHPIEAAIALRLGMRFPMPAIVKELDMEMCVIEQRHRYEVLPACLKNNDVYPDVHLHFWSWQRAKIEFLKRFEELKRWA